MTTMDTVHIVDVSETALKQFAQILEAEEKTGVRLSVVGGGCAGLQYKMDPVETAVEGDLVQQVNQVTFYIHPMAAPYLKGTRIDFEASLIDGGFKFVNPNASSTCGCGTSFGI